MRLAAIEHHVETVSPCPVILDDILINADNARASATLKVLSMRWSWLVGQKNGSP